MAVNKSRVPGIHKWSVQESLNQHLGVVIRVRPVIAVDSDINNRDLLVDSTAIPNAVSAPGGTSILRSFSIINYEDDAETSLDMFILFMTNYQDMGTYSLPVWVSDAEATTMNFLSLYHVDWSNNSCDLGSSKLFTYGRKSSGGRAPYAKLPLLLEAESDSTSVYFAVASDDLINNAAADSFEFIFHIEYR